MRTVAATALAAATACAGGPAGQGQAPRPVSTEPASRVLRAEELERYTGSSLYDGVRLLRPGFLLNRGARPSVFVNGMYFGPVASLHDIPAGAVRQIRLLTAPDAMARFGSFRHTGPALDVTLRAGVP